MKLKAALATALSLVAMLSASAAFAEPSFYVGVQKTEWDVTAYTNTARGEEETDGKQFLLGYQANENFGMELVLGKNSDVDDDENYYGVVLRPQGNLHQYLKVSAIFGLMRGPFFEGTDEISWGFGFAFTPIDQLAVTADWVHYADEDDGNGNGLRIAGINLGVSYYFGGDDD